MATGRCGSMNRRVGETPIAYLTRWRMLLAGERLTTTPDALSRIALSLGYESENAFNKAFRRVMECSPRRYVRADASLPIPPTENDDSDLRLNREPVPRPPFSGLGRLCAASISV